MAKLRRAARAWDLWATLLASACLLHCLALPLLVTLAPVASQLVDNHYVHSLLVMLAVPVTLWVVWNESRGGGSLWFRLVALSGITLMITAVTAFEAYEVPLTVVGATMLGCAHVWRWFSHQAPVDSLVIEGDA